MFKKHKKKVLLGIGLIFILIQLKTIDKTNPEADPGNDFLNITKAPAEVSELIHEVCYDCHSHSVRYPWYSNIAPVSWWLKGHVDNGLKKANFSDWNSYSTVEQDSIMTRSSRLVGLKWMPILTYKITHSEARLTEEQRHLLMKWFDSHKSYKEWGKLENNRIL